MSKLPNQNIFCILVFLRSAPAGHMPYKVYFMGIQPISANGFCQNLKGLSSKQLKYCKKQEHRAHMAQVLVGANLAIEECEYQFKNNRWNCSLSPEDKEKVFGRITGLNSGMLIVNQFVVCIVRFQHSFGIFCATSYCSGCLGTSG